MTAPTIVSPIPDQEHEPEAAVSFSVAAHFADAEDNGVLTYAASGLPSGLSISSSTGDITGSTTVAGTHVITVTATAPGNFTRQVQFSIIVQGAPSSAQTYHVNGSTGNDAWTGLSATFTSGTTGPWASITRANQVQPHGSGHVEISVAPGTYRNQPWVPQYSGTDASHRIKLRAASDGVVSLKGPTSGSMHYAMIFTNRSWMEVVRDSSTRYVEVDGEVEFGTGSGQVAKGDAPQPACHVRLAILLDGTSNNNILDFHMRRLGGDWNAVHVVDPVANNIFRVSCDQTGTPWMNDGADSGDCVHIWRSNSTATRNLIDGGSTGRKINRVGHDPFMIGAGSGTIRGIEVDNSWGTIATFLPASHPDGPDGNRCTSFASQNCNDVHMYNCLFQRNGMPQDGASANIASMIKHEGTRSVMSDCVLRNSRMEQILAECAAWSHHNRFGRTSHCVFDRGRGPLLYMTDWSGYSDSDTHPQSPLYDFCMKNIVARSLVSNPRPEWDDCLMVLWLGAYTSSNFDDAFPNGILHGFTLQDATRDWDDFQIEIATGPTASGGPGRQYVSWWLSNYPNLFSNWTITTDANLDNAPAATADGTITSINTEFLPVSDSLSIAQGVHLTTVSGSDSGSGTSLVVVDSTWFDNPVDGNPGFGPHSAGYFVNVNGTNREYTAISYTTHTLTMSAGFSRSAGQSVNRKIASGSVPNRGIRASN